MKFGTRIPDVA